MQILKEQAKLILNRYNDLIGVNDLPTRNEFGTPVQPQIKDWLLYKGDWALIKSIWENYPDLKVQASPLARIDSGESYTG